MSTETLLPRPTAPRRSRSAAVGPDRVGRALVTAAACAVGVLVVWATAVATARGQRLDTAAMTAAAGAPVRVVAATGALLGSVSVSSVAVAVVLLGAVALLRGDVRGAAASAVVLLGANLTTQWLEVTLPRPDLGVGTPTGAAGSLPSGHVTVVASLAVAAVLVAGPRHRAAAAAVGAALTGATAAAVLVWQWHRPSDVAAAVLVVAGWTALARLALRRGASRPILVTGPRRADDEEETHVAHREGTEVSWSWGNGTAGGTISEVHTDTVSRTTKGSEITRHGSDDNPAYVITQDDGTEVLKLDSEVEKA